MEKVNHFKCKRKKVFSMGPSIKFVLAIIDSISPQKMGVNFFSAKLDTKGGVGGPRALCLMPQNLRVLIFEYFPKTLGQHIDRFWMTHSTPASNFKLYPNASFLSNRRCIFLSEIIYSCCVIFRLKERLRKEGLSTAEQEEHRFAIEPKVFRCASIS